MAKSVKEHNRESNKHNVGGFSAAMRSPMFITGVCVVALIVVACVFGPYLLPYHPNDIDLQQVEAAPSAAHWLGTDPLGRDQLARLLYGGRMSLIVGLAAVCLQAVIGALLGAIAGYFGGFVDACIMRVTEIFQCFPFYPIAITLAALMGANIWNVVFIIGFLQWTGLCRLVRAEVMSLRESEFVLYANALGLPPLRILLHHLVRNCYPVILVNATLAVTYAVLSEAAMSFLGLGVSQPNPSWGNLLSQAQSLRVLSSEPWLWVPPGVAIIGLVLAVNAIGEALSHAITPQRSHVRDVDPPRTWKKSLTAKGIKAVNQETAPATAAVL